MVATTQAQIGFAAPRRVVVSKFVNLAYIAPGVYSVEFHRNGRVHRFQRSDKNRWAQYLYLHTRPVMFAGGLRVLK